MALDLSLPAVVFRIGEAFSRDVTAHVDQFDATFGLNELTDDRLQWWPDATATADETMPEHLRRDRVWNSARTQTILGGIVTAIGDKGQLY